MDRNDVFGCLPALKQDSEIKDEDFEVDSIWYNSFIDDVSEDLNPRKIHELVIDYLICNGYKEPAEFLRVDAEINFPSRETAPNMDTLDERNAIRDAIVSGDLEGAIDKIKQLTPTFLATNTTMHFKLLRQQLVELIRNKDIEKVLIFAQENLMDKYDQPPDLFAKLEQTYALLAFDNPENSPFGYLLSIKQRNMLAHEVNSAILTTLERNPVSKLEHLLRTMVWNQHQHKTKGDGRKLTSEVASSIAKGLFNIDDDHQSSEFL